MATDPAILRLLGAWVMPLACLFALGDWLIFRTEPPLALPGEPGPSRAARVNHKARTWAAAALFLILTVGLLRTWGEPPAVLLHFFSGPPGALWLVLALLLWPLIQAGAAWAARQTADPFRPHRPWPWLWLAASLALMLAWTYILTRLSPYREAQDLARVLGLRDLPAWRALPMAIALLTLAPILEESLFRHYLLYRLRWWLREAPAPRLAAALLTALLFACAHAGMLEPWWLKFLQVYGLGLILAATADRHGLEPAIALHWGFNLSLLVAVL